MLEVGQQVEDRGLHRHVERRGRLVADDDPGIAGERARDRDALLEPARQLRGRIDRWRSDSRTSAISFFSRVVSASPCSRRACDSAPRDQPLDRVPAVQRRVRVLEDDLERLLLLVRPLRGQVRRAPRRRASIDEPLSGAVRPSSTRASVVLPLPDSPTSPSVSPARSSTATSTSPWIVSGRTGGTSCDVRGADQRLSPLDLALSGAPRVSAGIARGSVCARSWKWQRERRPAPTSYSGGASVRQRSSTRPQRSAKMQPLGVSPAAGGSRESCRARGALVACRGAGCSAAARPCTDGAGRGTPRAPAPPRPARRRRARRRGRTSSRSRRGCG